LSDCVCEACGAYFDDPVDCEDGIRCPHCGSICVLMVEDDDETFFDYDEGDV
jgi:DNA-directed RNA polymerase subunit RPC12/RpoP